MSKQDRQAVRTARDIETKYDLGRLKTASGSASQEIQISNLTQTMNQYMANTNAKIEELENRSEMPDIDTTLKIDEEGLLGVNTTAEVKEGNKLPITSEAVALAIASLVLGELPDNVLTQEDLEEVIELINSQKIAKIGWVTLLASAWIGEGSLYHQVVEIEGVTENSQVDLTPDVEQLAIFYEKDLSFVTENDGGTVTVYAIGQKPLNDYTIQVTITEVDI